MQNTHKVGKNNINNYNKQFSGGTGTRKKWFKRHVEQEQGLSQILAMFDDFPNWSAPKVL